MDAVLFERGAVNAYKRERERERDREREESEQTSQVDKSSGDCIKLR